MENLHAGYKWGGRIKLIYINYGNDSANKYADGISQSTKCKDGESCSLTVNVSLPGNGVILPKLEIYGLVTTQNHLLVN